MADDGVMEDVVKAEVGDDTSIHNESSQAVCFVIEGDSVKW